jgi:hypothetical protein
MRIHPFMIVLMLFAAAATSAAQQARAASEQPYEPWTKNAKVGDFMEYKIGATGEVLRKEVTEITDKFVIVTCKNPSTNEGPTIKYSRKEPQGAGAPALLAGRTLIELKKTSSTKLEIGGQTVACEVWDGLVKGESAKGDVIELKAQKIIGTGAPFDGVLKIMLAKDGGKPLDIANVKAAPVKNAGDQLEVLMEATSFGNTQQKK